MTRVDVLIAVACSTGVSGLVNGVFLAVTAATPSARDIGLGIAVAGVVVGGVLLKVAQCCYEGST